MLDYVLTDGGKFFSSKFGIIKSLYERRTAIATSDNRDIVSIININNKKSINGGGNQSKQCALIASIGEAIERYCLKSYNVNMLIRATYKEIKYDKPTVRQLTFFMQEQYELYPSLPRFSIDDKINWVIGDSFLNSSQSAIPASLVYLPYFYTNQESALSVQLSPGTACHYDYNQAVLLALLECIERDAFTLFWEAGIKFPLISHLDTNAYLQYKGIKLTQCQMYCVDITTDINIPVILTIILSANEQPPFVSIGIAAALEPMQALDKSISEAITSWRSSYEIALNTNFDFETVMGKLINHPDFVMHAMYHCFVDTRPYLYELFADCPIATQFVNLSQTYTKQINISQALYFLRTRLVELGYDFTIVNITTEDIKDHGLYVIRAICFDLIRPSLGLIYRHLNNARFINVPKSLGLSSHRNTMQEILDFRVPAP